MIQEITKLTDEWYSLIGKDHHKDRDCHWYIETKWSYGQPPKYNVQHWGYILDHIEEECTSYDEALHKLKEILIKEIQEYRSYIKQD
jgi:hypothetical protein